MKILSTALIVLYILLSSTSYSQRTNKEISKLHDETPDDPYKPQDPAKVQRTSAYSYEGSFYTTTQVNVDSLGLNILSDAANEPSIAIHPNDRNIIMIGWRQFDNVLSNFRQAGNGFSTDGGQSWTVPEPIEAGVFRSDPVLETDAEGNFYYNSLEKGASGNYWCVIHRAMDGSLEWDNGTYAHGGDKQWMTIDKTDGIGEGNIYEFWNSSYSSCSPGSYTRSTDGGNSYEDCDGVMGDPIWGTMAVGSDGKLYTVGMRNYDVVATRSSNAQDPDQQTSWDFATYVDLDGEMVGHPAVNPEGLMGQVWIDTDDSDGPGKDNVYVLCSVERYDPEDNADVMFARSTDQGSSWDDPVRVNDDLDLDHNNWQWFGTMSVAPNGRIDAIWLDTRNAPGTNEFISELYYSYSLDQGQTWSLNECISEPFDPKAGYPNQLKLGDYFDMISDNDMVHVAWAATFTGGQDVYYTRIDPYFVGINNKVTKPLNLSSYPNPASDRITFRYTTDKAGIIEMNIFDITGKKAASVLNEYQQSGNHNVHYNINNLPAGIYYTTLKAGRNTATIKISCVK